MYTYEEQNKSFRVNEGGSYDFQSHFHPHIEICYAVEGPIGIRVENSEYVLQSGDISFIFPNIIHGLYIPDENHKGDMKLLIVSPVLAGAYRNIIFKMIPSDPILRAKDVTPDILTAINGIVRASHMTNQPQTQGLFADVSADSPGMNYSEDKNSGDKEAASCYFILLLMQVLRALPFKSTTVDLNTDLAHRLIVYLQTHYMEELNLDAIAKALFVSKGQISRVMSSQLHTSLPTFMNQLRLESALDMLRSSDMMISEISERCGFNSERTFHRTFRARFGVEPRKFRQFMQKHNCDKNLPDAPDASDVSDEQDGE